MLQYLVKTQATGVKKYKEKNSPKQERKIKRNPENKIKLSWSENTTCKEQQIILTRQFNYTIKTHIIFC